MSGFHQDGGALTYLDRPKRTPAQIVVDCRRLAETCRAVAKHAASACNQPVALYYEQMAADLEVRATGVERAAATGEGNAA